ncbi:CFA47 protein, partial [Centropus unirufus]|nr:CFA47 protein [Centropus unirufus]
YHKYLFRFTGTRLAPKDKLDIPVLFMPDAMKMYETMLVIHVMRENGENWPYENSSELNKDLKSWVTVAENGGIQGILWVHPVYGIPEAPQQNLVPDVIRCQSRQRVERRVGVLLTGVVPGANLIPPTRNAAKDSISKPANVQEIVQVTDGSSTTMEFMYELQYPSNEIKSRLGPLVGMHLIESEWDTESRIITLIFNIVFAPNKPMRNEATLVVQCTTGGIWKFPMLFIATEPQVDDVINIEAVGLNKESVVGFKLTSQTR